MTFNIRGSNIQLSIHGKLAGIAAETIMKYKPIIFGTQEGKQQKRSSEI